MIRTWAHTATRSSTFVPSPLPSRPATRGRTPAPRSPGTRSGRARSARRARARASRRCPRSAARIRSASPRWLPSKRRGRCTFLIAKAVSTPANTSTANSVDEERVPRPGAPSHGSVACLSTIPIIAITIVGSSTMKPQKIAACISPGTSRWNSLLWPSTTTASFRTRCGTSSKRADGLAHPHEPLEQVGPPCEDSAADDGDDEQDEAGDH